MPEFTPAGYLLIGLTGIVGFLAGVMGFALLRLFGAVRRLRCASRPSPRVLRWPTELGLALVRKFVVTAQRPSLRGR